MSTFLPGAEKYYATAMDKNRRPQSEVEKLIERANAVSIFDVLQDFFGLNLPREGMSYKSHCPFAHEHADRGLDKGFRTYPNTNSSMCFPMHGYMPPVRLVSIQYNERYARSAERILRNYDLLKPKPWRDRYQDLLLEKERAQSSVGNPQHAVEALNVALRGIPSYTARQFDTDVLEAMEEALESLNKVVEDGDPDRVRVWYETSKSDLRSLLEGTN